MTHKECLDKIEELKLQALKIIDNRTAEILGSGFIDIESFGDNYLLPKQILCASLGYTAKQFEPLNDKGLETLKNLKKI